MNMTKLAGLSALALSISVTAVSALTLEEVKKQGYIRAATANEVPYSYMQPDGTSAGIGPDVANAVLKSMGIEEVNWTVTPFGTLIPGLKARRFDFAAAEQNISPERCKQVAFTEPNSSYGEGLLVKKGNPKKLTTYADIAKDPALKVAVVSGANNVDFLRAVGVKEDQIVFIPANADAEQVKPFVDPVVKDAPVRNYGGFAFRPEDKELRDAFNAALVEFRKTEDYKKILAKYGLSEQSIAAAAEKKVADLCAGK
jgi:polar amino acid transport system substrate-binding protein